MITNFQLFVEMKQYYFSYLILFQSEKSISLLWPNFKKLVWVHHDTYLDAFHDRHQFCFFFTFGMSSVLRKYTTLLYQFLIHQVSAQATIERSCSKSFVGLVRIINGLSYVCVIIHAVLCIKFVKRKLPKKKKLIPLRE